MPFGGLPPVPGEYGTVSIRVGGREIDTFISFTITSHFLTPSDGFRFELGDEVIQSELIKLLVAGEKVEIFIDDDKQMTGYIDVVDTFTDAQGGTRMIIEGRDTMSPVLDSQIDPDHHYPDKVPLDVLIRDVLEPFGFTRFEIAAAENILTQAGKAAQAKKPRRHKTPRKALSKYPIPKSKPQHNDSFFVFLSRITQRYGLWMWPSVDGDGVVVDKPDYDQDPLYHLQLKRDGVGNNVKSGGIRVDASEQPSFIVARGNIPARAVEHSRMRMVIGSPYDDVVGRVLGVRPDETPSTNATQLGAAPGESGTFFPFTAVEKKKRESQEAFVARLLGVEQEVKKNDSLTGALESGTFNSLAERRKTEMVKDITYIKQKQVTEARNAFAGKVARVRFLRDKDSRTMEELEHFARRQMSLTARKAFVAKYTIPGLRIDGSVPTVNTVASVVDEMSNFEGRLWIQSREITMSRQSGTQTSIEMIPMGALQF